MSDTSWDLRGVDPEARRKVEEDAARLGVSVADYLADLVVRQAVIDQLNAGSENEQPPSEPESALIFAPPPESSEGFAVRQRLKTLERRLSTAVGSLDGAVHALDTSFFDITARVGDVEALAGDTAHALGQTQQEVSNAVAGLQIQFAVVEDNLAGQAKAQDERAAGLDRRIDKAERSIGALAEAQEALKHAVADDFAAFTHETADRLNASLAELRAAADAAAAQADAAVAHLVNELRSVRLSLEDRLEEAAEETRSRMQAAFEDTSERLAALSQRVSDNERFVSRTAEQLRAQMTDVEDSAQTALEAARYDLGSQIHALREAQAAQLDKLNLLDAAVGKTGHNVTELRGAVESRVREIEGGVRGALQQAHTDWDQRFDALTARLSRAEQHAQQLQQRLGAELDRIETSTFAAIEKLRRELAAGDASAAQQLDAALTALREDVNEVRNRAINEVHLLREQNTSALARLTLLDTAVTRLEGASITNNARFEQLESALASANPDLERRIAQLERAIANAESEQALASVRADVAALTERLDILYADTALSDRLTALHRGLDLQQTRMGELNDSVQGLARMLNRVASQGAETAQRADERVHQVEVALADLRLQALSKGDANAASVLETLEDRMAAFEARHSSALEALRADIARFVADNDRRLEALEAKPEVAADVDLAAEFESLRGRIEERVLGVELRSVRTLEQVVDTVAMLEQRFLSDAKDKPEAQTA